MAIEQSASYNGVTGHSGPLVVQTDIASFRDLVQRLTGLPAENSYPALDPIASSCYPEQKTEVGQPRRGSRGANRRRQPREEIYVESHGMGNSHDFQLSTAPDVEGLGFPEPQWHGMDQSRQGENGEAPELLTLFPLSSPSLRY